MKKEFLKYQAQTTPHPLAIEIEKADGCYVYDTSGKKYLDFIAGVSANTLGHNHPKVSNAIKKQVDAYTHVMVYGEFIQKPSLELCKLLAQQLPDSLSTVYLTNSGTEATEGAMKLAKKVTGRSEFVACNNAYHGNTQGAMSLCGAEEQNSAFRPLLPGVKFIEYSHLPDLHKITEKTAAVVMETIQGGAGCIVPENNYLFKVKERCQKVGALLILDEIQSGIGRTGNLFGFQTYNVIPDIFITGKGLGGGMPIGAFVSSQENMTQLKDNPKLGHITTFGGHPVVAAAALSTLTEVIDSNLMAEVKRKENILKEKLQHSEIKEVRGTGLMLSLMLENPEKASKVILDCMSNGLLLFWLLYEGCAVRITPPLTISDEEIMAGCDIILNSLNKL
ncbi:aspartate aminotransferase family protein [Flavicella marina]|uniref:aspartate aminotransferase family protein n=1 Tax=Flavicella marina TaxID=1475951 RepID=UPI0012648973|nr:aspartate aminotransferase family protein [Flavicella marina]